MKLKQDEDSSVKNESNMPNKSDNMDDMENDFNVNNKFYSLNQNNIGSDSYISKSDGKNSNDGFNINKEMEISPKTKQMVTILGMVVMIVVFLIAFFPKIQAAFTYNGKTTGEVISVTEEIRVHSRKTNSNKASRKNERVYEPTVEYTVDGVKYTKIYEATSTKYEVGDDIKICYDEKNPNNSSYDNGTGGKIMLIIPIMMVFILVVTVIYKVKKK